jgi:hypothetical protein
MMTASISVQNYLVTIMAEKYFILFTFQTNPLLA